MAIEEQLAVDHRRILAETFIASAEHHDEIASTNDRARACAAEGWALPRLVTADLQTAGRGRGANRWWTGPGGLAMSLLLPAELLPKNLGHSVLVSLVAGIATVEAVRPFAGKESLGLHWPNDVMLAGRKLSGILVEALPGRQHVVGIGVNTNNTAADAPAEIRERVATLRDATGQLCDRVELAVRLLQEFERGLRQLAAAPEDVARRANELCLQRGHTLTLRVADEQLTGRCQGIAADGALLLDVAGRARPFYSGILQY